MFAFPDNIGEMDLDGLLDVPEQVDGETILDVYGSDSETWSITYGTGLNVDDYTEFRRERDGRDTVEDGDIPGIPVAVYRDSDEGWIRRFTTVPSFTPPVNGKEGVLNVERTDDPGDWFNGMLRRLDPFEALKFRHRERSYDLAEVDADDVTAYPAPKQRVVDDIGEDDAADIYMVTASAENHDPDLERNPEYALRVLNGAEDIGERLDRAAEQGVAMAPGLDDFAGDYLRTTAEGDRTAAEAYVDGVAYRQVLESEVARDAAQDPA